jgi:DNA-3-methyladenine glycosylase
VARDLLGCRIHRLQPRSEILVGTIVETEAYAGPEDLACHAARGRTPRTEVMFGQPGHAYVFLVYGMHHCLNFVVGPGLNPAAVLVRAVLLGDEAALAGGPGLVCRALRVTRAENGSDVTRPPLWVEEGPPPDARQVVASPRVGVDYAGEWAARPWRFRAPGAPGVRTDPRR